MKASSTERIASLEWLRLIAAFEVVWFHLPNSPFRSVACSGLVVFLLLTFSFMVLSWEKYHFKDFVSHRVNRLIVPWLFWSLIYFVFRLLRTGDAHDHFFSDVFSFRFLFGGGYIHLWYLPFVFIFSLGMYFICQWLKDFEKDRVFVGSLFAINLAIIVSSMIIQKMKLPYPFHQWAFAFSAMPIGFSIGLALKEKNVIGRFITIVLIGCMSLVLCFALGFSKIFIPYLIGLPLVFIFFFLRLPYQAVAIKLGSLTYGIYLVHPLVISFCRHVLHIKQLIILGVLTFLISMLVVFLMRKTFLSRFV